MKPRIIALCGPLKKSEFYLGSGDLTIGRASDSLVCLKEDPTVSRRHCMISYEKEHALVADLGSFQGTFVNGFSVPGQFLSHGDRIRVGRSIFVYVDRDEVDDVLLTVTRADEEWNRPWERTPGYEPATASVLQAFLRITASINAMRTAEEIQPCVLEFILRVIPLECVAILLTGHDRDRFVSSMYRRTGSQDGEAFPVNETMVRKVLREGVPAYEEKVVCCPLLASGTAIGVIYAAMAPSGFEFFTKGHTDLLASIAGFTAVALEHARYVEWLEGENLRLNEVINVEHGMIGESSKMKEVYQFIGRAAPTDRPVLITGETGTGKELAARAIHQNSSRSTKPFVAVNCGAFTETLLQSELFGHEKGAFTGAETQRKGLFETADGGTLFLDEIGELPITMQADLLRVLQHGEFKRVGGNSLIKVNVRIVAATNRNLQEAIKNGRFRQDLFFRLDVLTLEMPRLSERREDILLLAAHFMKKYSQIRTEPFPPVVGISPEALHLLVFYSWPGNVRELENAIERGIALGVTPDIRPEDLPKALRPEISEPGQDDTYDDEFEKFQKSLFERRLQLSRGDHAEAARGLDLHPKYFRRRCRALNVKWP